MSGISCFTQRTAKFFAFALPQGPLEISPKLGRLTESLRHPWQWAYWATDTNTTASYIDTIFFTSKNTKFLLTKLWRRLHFNNTSMNTDPTARNSSISSSNC